MLTRREFSKRTGTGLLALATGLSFTLTGCNVFDSIANWIPTGIAAINGIITVLGALVPPQALVIISLVKAALADLAATVNQYRNDTEPTHKDTLLHKIRTILADIVQNFQSFLDALNLGSNPIEAVVIGLANIILSAIAGFIGQLPAPPAGTVPVATTFHVGGRQMPITPKLYKNNKGFIADYNQVAEIFHHPEIDLH
jgi:hypothetical protein